MKINQESWFAKTEDMKFNFLNPIAQNLKIYFPGEQPQTNDWVKLNTNEFPYPPSPCVREELKKISLDYEILKKYPHPLSEPLRSQIAGKWGVSPDDVLVGNGSDEVLMLIARTTLDHKETAAIPEVTYSLYETIVSSVGANIQLMPMSKTHEPFRIDLGKLEKSESKAIFLANPNAITGEWHEAGRLKEVIHRSDKLWIIDEAYVNFAHNKKASFLHHLTDEKNVVVVQTFSKGYGLAGLRVGYAVSKNRNLMKGLYSMKDSYNQDSIAVRLAIQALKDEEYYRQKINEVKAQRNFLSTQLKQKRFNVLSSQANFLLVSPPQKDAERLYIHLKNKKILVRYFKGTPFSDHIRVSIGLPRENAALLSEVGLALKIV